MDDDGLHPRAGNRNPVSRLGSRSIRHQATVHRHAGRLHAGFAAVRVRINYRAAHHISRGPGRRWRNVAAPGICHHDPRSGTSSAWATDVDHEHPDAARPDRRPDSRWLAHRHRQLEMDLLHQRADRACHDGPGGDRVPERPLGAVGDAGRRRPPAALARPGDVPFRGVVHPPLRDRGRSPRADTGGNRPGIHRRVRRARVASRRSPTHRSAAFSKSGDQLGQRDDADFRRRVFRRRTVIPELLPAGTASHPDAGRSAFDPPGARGHADHAADRTAGGPSRDRARSCWSVSV